jgi:outer membrane surface antigen
VPSCWSRRTPYSETPRARLRRRALGALPGGVVALALGLACAGCSFSYQLDSLWSKGGDSADTTGSLRLATPRQASTLPPENDLVIARAAVSEVLTKGGKDTSMPWENPRTGARGTITPIASAYDQDGVTCRDFLASYVRDGSESWLQGEACRAQKGRWEVRTLKPWQKT